MYFNNLEDLKLYNFRLDTQYMVIVPKNEYNNITNLIEYMNKFQINFFGGVYSYIIYDNKFYENGFLIREMKNVSLIKTININDLDKDKLLLEGLKNNSYIGILMYDNNCEYLHLILDQLYKEKAGKLNLYGCGAGIYDENKYDILFTNKNIVSSGAILCIMENNNIIENKNSYEVLNGPIIPNKIKNNIIKEINWEIPFKIYKYIIENNTKYKIDNNNIEHILLSCPLGIIEDNQQILLRNISKIKNENEMILNIPINENNMVYVMKINDELLHESIKSFLLKYRDIIEKKSHNNIFIIENIYRFNYIKEVYYKSDEYINVFDNDKYIIEGIVSLSEIFTDHNNIFQKQTNSLIIELEGE